MAEMNTDKTLRPAVQQWIDARAAYVPHALDPDWIAGDPVVGHLAAAAWLLALEGKNKTEIGHSRLAQSYYSNHGNWIVWSQQLRQVLATLHQSRIAVIPLKGVVLRDQLYVDAGIRPMGDIDLLVRSESYVLAAQKLEELGYRLDESNSVRNVQQIAARLPDDRPMELGFRNDSGLKLELHRHVVTIEWFVGTYTVNMDEVWQRSLPMENGGEHTCRTC